MNSPIVKEMISAASNAFIKSYIQSDEYKAYILLKEGDLGGMLNLVRKSTSTTDIDKSQLEKELETLKKEFPEHQTYLKETEQSIKQNGFEEYFLKEDVKLKVMTEVIKYLMANPEGTTSYCPFSEGEDVTLQYAFDQGIKAVLKDNQYNILKKLARENKISNKTWREPESGELVDPKLRGFIFNQLNYFVKTLYAKEFQVKGNLL